MIATAGLDIQECCVKLVLLFITEVIHIGTTIMCETSIIIHS